MPIVGCPSRWVELIAPVTGSVVIRMAPPAMTLGAWHCTQSLSVSVSGWSPSLGGMPWHDPHTACEVPPVQLGVGIRVGATSRAARVPAPWHYTEPQVALAAS